MRSKWRRLGGPGRDLGERFLRFDQGSVSCCGRDRAAVEQSQANGRAEQQALALRERLHISVVDVRPTGAEVVFDHLVSQNLLATSVISAVVARSKYPHSSDKAPSDVTGFLERVLMHNRTHDDKQPRFLVGWSLRNRYARHHHLDVRFECHTPRPVEVRSSTKQ